MWPVPARTCRAEAMSLLKQGAQTQTPLNFKRQVGIVSWIQIDFHRLHQFLGWLRIKRQDRLASQDDEEFVAGDGHRGPECVLQF